ncbi:HAMP domain-containing histidine kinase [bacterium]|nr:HAMP domain-containing histidine kinase [bacterium]
MAKFIKGKNRLKDLIYIQENKPCSEKAIDGMVRSMLEPLFESPEEKGVVLYRFSDENKYSGLLRRLGYTAVDVYNFSNGSDILKENIWEETQFLYVLTGRYGASFIYDFETEDVENFAGYYLLYNSVNLRESFEMIEENCTRDISAYKEQYKPDRRDNLLMNASIRKVVDLMSETTQEAMIADIEKDALTKSDDLAKRLEFINSKSRYVVHEIRNQLSICELYANIIEKHCELKDNADCTNAVDCIKTAVKIASSALMDLKSLDNKDLQVYSIREMVEKAVLLAKVYAKNKNIEFKTNFNDKNSSVFADEAKFLAALVNIIKNAIEAIEDSGEISVSTSVKDDFISIVVSNNGAKIPEDVQKKIFSDGFTTKASGSGIGLYVCRQTLEEQFARLELLKSDDNSTEFEILVSMV